MKHVHLPFKMLTMLGFFLFSAATTGAAMATDLLDHDVKRLNSDEVVNLRDAYAGKVVLIVNTASKCAFTGQYEGLEALYARYKDRGLEVLGFPSNDFGSQEPGSEQQIQDFCRLTYSVKFPMFAKTEVKKGKASPLFEGLAQAAGRYPKWNFHKYLIGRDGKLIDNYLSWTSPQSGTIVDAIEAAL
ncbi:MAG: glutathione peroxidase [Gammaproteobacteria bacterium]|nr:glutathione peroxidase [Gammaproteobacteria bacterium]MCB1816828.1 glutathione peroxidase [Gammaproteobacteria bacterium]MCP5317510.1 glutathione peroxidase [Chromatiaceae bacterium]MCP5436181.1 glutathione peroxidase [Chromatiaceae bacterium]MCW5585878.1 glutathione peroxidase [Chromatiales bacterium]